MEGWACPAARAGGTDAGCAIVLSPPRGHPYKSPLFVFSLIIILVSHREGAKIKVKNRVKIKWNTTLICIRSAGVFTRTGVAKVPAWVSGEALPPRCAPIGPSTGSGQVARNTA